MGPQKLFLIKINQNEITSTKHGGQWGKTLEQEMLLLLTYSEPALTITPSILKYRCKKGQDKLLFHFPSVNRRHVVILE